MTITETTKLAKRNGTWFQINHTKGHTSLDNTANHIHITDTTHNRSQLKAQNQISLGIFHQSRTFLSIEYKPVGIFPPMPGHHIQENKNPSAHCHLPSFQVLPPSQSLLGKTVSNRAFYASSPRLKARRPSLLPREWYHSWGSSGGGRGEGCKIRGWVCVCGCRVFSSLSESAVLRCRERKGPRFALLASVEPKRKRRIEKKSLASLLAFREAGEKDYRKSQPRTKR
jgi:hypothetical protein